LRAGYSLAVDAARSISHGLEIYGHMDWMHRSAFNSTPTNNIYGVVPGYRPLNGCIGLRNGGTCSATNWMRIARQSG
jgi:iron complex outermembrane receptor protein